MPGPISSRRVPRRLLTVLAGVVPAALLSLSSCSGASSGEPSAPEAAATTTDNKAASAPVASGRLGEAVREGRPVQIGVFGDSFSDGLWWALDQDFKDGNVADVHRLGKAATGFADYTKGDLSIDIRRKLEKRPVDVAVIMYGANDTQPLHGAERPTPFLSDEWKRVVSGRIAAIINMFKERGITVMWVGLPKMRSENYDERARGINAFYADEMRRHGVYYLETVSLTSDANGAYVPNLTGKDGQSRPARSRDGIHMTMSGYRILSAPLAERVRTMIDDTRRAVANPG